MVLQIGRFNLLSVKSRNAGGFVLGDAPETAFLPRSLASDQVAEGRQVRVFLFYGGGGEVLASMRPPKALLGEFAYLECVSVSDVGAFMDWGLPKDLLVPYALQHQPLVEGQGYVVFVDWDRRGERIVGSTRLGPHFDYDTSDLQRGDAVDVLVYACTPSGAQVVVDQRYAGFIHLDATARPLEVGETLSAFVARVRNDNRLDITLSPPAAREVFGDAAQDTILLALEGAGGFLPLHDKSDPEAIFSALGLSKKVFKRSVGGLYKARRIVLESDGIRLLEED